MIFSGISSLLGELTNLPVCSVASHSNQLYFEDDLEARLSVIANNDLDFSRIPTISPCLRVNEGILTFVLNLINLHTEDDQTYFHTEV